MVNSRYIIYVLFWLLVLTISCQKEKGTELKKPPGTDPTPNTESTFINPILPSGPDPWVIQKDEFYYYTHTLGNRIGLAKTKAVSRLSQSPLNTIWTPPPGTSYSTNIWAPQLRASGCLKAKLLILPINGLSTAPYLNITDSCILSGRAGSAQTTPAFS